MTTEHHALCDDNGWDHPGPCVIETEPAPVDPDEVWNALTPAAKADWVRAMQPEPPVEGTCSTCGAAYGEMGHDPEPCEGYDPTDPGFTPEAERCPAGGAHVWTDNLTPAQILTGLRPRSGVLVWCEECGATAAVDPEDR